MNNSPKNSELNLKNKAADCASLAFEDPILTSVNPVSYQLGEFAVGAPATYTARFFRGYQPVSFGVGTAIAAGRLQASLDFALGENDLWIAAQTLECGAVLIAFDQPFHAVPGLRVG